MFCTTTTAIFNSTFLEGRSTPSCFVLRVRQCSTVHFLRDPSRHTTVWFGRRSAHTIVWELPYCCVGAQEGRPAEPRIRHISRYSGSRGREGRLASKIYALWIYKSMIYKWPRILLEFSGRQMRSAARLALGVGHGATRRGGGGGGKGGRPRPGR